MEPMMDCEPVLQQLWDYLDGELTTERRAEIVAHLQVCGRCFPTFQFEKAFLQAVQRAGAESPPSRGGLREQVLAALRAQGMPESPPHAKR